MNDSDEDNFFGSVSSDTSVASAPTQAALFNDDLVQQKQNFEIPDDFDIVIDTNKSDTPNTTPDVAVFEVDNNPSQDNNLGFNEGTTNKKW